MLQYHRNEQEKVLFFVFLFCYEIFIYSDFTKAKPHKLLTCTAIPFSQVASYLLPFAKCITPFPWNLPSLHSPTYLVPEVKVYSPAPCILRKRAASSVLCVWIIWQDTFWLFLGYDTCDYLQAISFFSCVSASSEVHFYKDCFRTNRILYSIEPVCQY